MADDSTRPDLPAERTFRVPVDGLRLDGEAWQDGTGASIWFSNRDEPLVRFDVTGGWEDRSSLWIGFEGFGVHMAEDDIYGDEDSW